MCRKFAKTYLFVKTCYLNRFWARLSLKPVYYTHLSKKAIFATYKGLYHLYFSFYQDFLLIKLVQNLTVNKFILHNFDQKPDLT